MVTRRAAGRLSRVRYQDPTPDEQDAFRRRQARIATDELDALAVGMEVVRESDGADLGTVTSVVGRQYRCSGDPLVGYSQAELRVVPAGAVVAAALEARARAALGVVSIDRLTARGVTLTRAPDRYAYGINIDMSRGALLAAAARSFSGTGGGGQP